MNGRKTRRARAATSSLTPLVTHSINRLTYRQFDYAIFMTFQRQLARWFHKRLSHNYTQAALMDPYHIRMSTIVRDSALVNAQRIRDQARYIEESLEELVEKNVLLRYSKNVIAGQRKKIEDITYVLTPHPLFVSEITTANKRSSKLSQLALTPQQDPPTIPASLEK